MINKKDSKTNSPLHQSILSALFQEAKDALLILDGDGVVQYANQVAAILFENKAEELIGYNLGVQEDRTRIIIPNSTKKDNNGSVIELNVSKIQLESQPVYMVIARDITELVQKEKSLDEKSKLFETPLQNDLTGSYGVHSDHKLASGITLFHAVYDEQGDPAELMVIKMNQVMAAVFGKSPEECAGSSALSLCKSPVLVQKLWEIVLSREAESFEFQSELTGRSYIVLGYSPKVDWVEAVAIDLTDFIEQKAKLQNREAEFLNLFELMSQGVIYHDRNGEVISANSAAEKILGISINEWTDQNQTILGDLQLLKINGEPLDYTEHPINLAINFNLPTRDYIFGVVNARRKELIWVSMNVLLNYRSGEDQPYQIISTYLDVTDTIRVQKTLEERIKELNCLSNISRLLQEKESVEMVRQSVEVEIIKTMHLSEDAVLKIRLNGEVQDSEQDNSTNLREFNFPIKFQDQMYGEINLRLAHGSPLLLEEEHNILHTIAERLGLWYRQHETQIMLAESERRFRNAFINAPNPIIIHAQDGEIITVNDALVRRTGYTRDELKCVADWVERAHPNRAAEIIRMVRENFETETQHHNGEYPVRTKSGEILVWYFSSATLGELPDGRMLVITVALDITERIKMDRERQAYTQRLVALRQLDEVINSSLELDEVLHLITSQLRKLIACDSMTILQVDGENLTVLACEGFTDEEEILKLVFPSKPEYPNYEVVAQKRPVVINNVSEAFPLFHQPSDRKGNETIKAWLGIPLVVQDEAVGMFTIDRCSDNGYTNEEIEIAQQFANRAAIAITNAKLFKQMKSNLEKIQILRQVDTAITSSQEVDEVLETVLTQVVKGLQVEIAVIFLFDEETQSLSYVSNVGYRNPGHPEICIPIGQGYSGLVAKQKSPVFIPEIEGVDDGRAYPFNYFDEDVVAYYGFPLISKGKFMGVMEVLNRSRLEPDEAWFEFAETLARQTAVAVDNITLFSNLQKVNREIREAYDATIEGWARALEIRDKETEGHSRRVVELTTEVAERCGVSGEELEHLQRGVILHDIGKMGIPDDILRKPGPLGGDEWQIMRQHPLFAHEMLKDIEYLRPACNIPLYHHERWDGSGYPEGLSGEEIPHEARIFAVVDAWDALTSDRPYRDAWSPEKAKQYLVEQAGKEFDPKVVKIFLEILGSKL